MIFHVTTAEEWTAGQHQGRYTPRRFAADGFVHCAGTLEVALAVRASYFAPEADVLVVQLDEARLDVELKWEAPAPLASGVQRHHALATSFPHVYGSIPLTAVVQVRRALEL
jgi:uncharacterized protein (DUF952 family)